MKPRKLGIPAVRKFRSKAENWTDALAYAAEMTARELGYVAYRNPAARGVESFDGRTWTVDAAPAAVVEGAGRAGSLLLDAGCARCGEPLDVNSGDICTPCRKELDRKHDAMIRECAELEAA